MIVQLAIEVSGLRGYQQGSDFAETLANHIAETFNDDDSISPLMHYKLFNNDGVTQIKKPRKRESIRRHVGVECAECNGIIGPLHTAESTYCGSMHVGCREDHNQHCDACKEDAP